MLTLRLVKAFMVLYYKVTKATIKGWIDFIITDESWCCKALGLMAIIFSPLLGLGTLIWVLANGPESEKVQNLMAKNRRS